MVKIKITFKGQRYFRKNGFALRLALKQRAQGNSEIANLRKSKITKKGGGGLGSREIHHTFIFALALMSAQPEAGQILACTVPVP